LFHLYGLADQAFSGGSLIPKGGHNFLEIAVWGIPPLYGPSFNNFSDAHELLQRHQTGFCLPDCDAIAATALRLLKDPQLAGLHRQRCNAAIAELGTHAQQQISAAMA
jgi:3-deoxy-D-manno-octulosonic-acid transferase